MQLFHEKLAIQILKSKFFIWTLIPCFTIGILIVVYFSSISDFTVFPNKNNYQFIFYTDGAVGGNSHITEHIINDSVIKINFVLKDSIENPYIGLSIAPKAGSTINLAHYNQIGIKVRGTNMDNLGIALYTINTYSFINKQITEVNFYTTFKISSQINQYIIPTEKFNVPDWWIEHNNISNTENIRLDLTGFLRLNICNAYTPNIGEKQSLEIYSIIFNRNNKPLIMFILSIECIVILLVFLILLLAEQFRTNKNSVTIHYRPVEDAKKDAKTVFIDYVNDNFHNSLLCIENVSNETGASARKITNYMQNQFACNFKTYINRLRINESKRLLIETELNIGEIAYKVGFNNQSHFNRVFKTEMNISPTEFRDKSKTTK